MNIRTGSLLMLALVTVGCLGLPPTVEQVTMVNPTVYDLEVDVSGQARSGWLPVAIVAARSQKVAQDVPDQGDRWIFRFRHWGDPVGELSLTRTDLERTGWRVEIPEQIEGRLQQLGRPPSG